MFSLAYHPYASVCQPHNPYEHLYAQQLQRRRQLEAYRLRRQLELEELNRRREYEHACRQAEVQRIRETELGRAARKTRSSCGHSTLQELFGARYGGRATSSSPSDQQPMAQRLRSEPAVAEPDELSVEETASVPLNQETNSPAQSPKPAATSTPSAPSLSNSEIEAETTEADQASQVDTSPSHTAISNILSTFTSLKSNFTFPTQLDFLPDSPSPKLSYTPTNAPLHQYEHVLTGLLTHLDAVESYGDLAVRKARKDDVTQIEKELGEMDRRKMEQWTGATTVEAESLPEIDVSDTTPMTEFDPARIPLPQDDDEETESSVSEPLVAASSSPVSTPSASSDANQHSLTEASTSDTSDSELDSYVDVDADMMSDTSADDETEEIEQDRNLTSIDDWDLDF